jgi:DNA-nicking Smr family endonuclease
LLTSIFIRAPRFPCCTARQYTLKQARAEGSVSGNGDDEGELFRKAMRGVKPLPVPARVPVPRRSPPARARFTRADRLAVLRESIGPPDPDLLPGDSLEYRREGVPATLLRRLRLGELRIEAEIDLHGMTEVDGVAALREFLAEAASRDQHCLRVVHGKGLRSGARGPVLKLAVHRLLRRLDAVLAVTSASLRGGGTGATLLLLEPRSARRRQR